MLIIVDRKISAEAKKVLATFGELLELATGGITYPAISGHPDIFICQSPDKLIIAPNLPQKYFDQLNDRRINYIKGELLVGPEYPASACYNAVATSKYFIHNLRHTDPVITRELQDLTPVHVDQGYCRCNLLPLKNDHFITTDYGILKGLQPLGLQPLGLQPEGILLEGFPHGFFGGCCGVWEDTVLINGNLQFYKEGEKVREFIVQSGYAILELYPGPLVDVGSIIFI